MNLMDDGQALEGQFPFSQAAVLAGRDQVSVVDPAY